MGRPLEDYAEVKTLVRGSEEEAAHFAALKAADAEFEAVLGDLPIDEMVAEYYDTSGQFAGQYVVHEVLANRSEKVSNDEFRVHAKYSFRKPSASEPQGEDRRMFQFAKRDGRWQVVSMGGARSGRIE